MGREAKEWRGKRKNTRGENRTAGRDPSSQKGLNIDFQGGARHGQLKFGDHIRMKDPKLPNALMPGKDLSTSPGEERRS